MAQTTTPDFPSSTIVSIFTEPSPLPPPLQPPVFINCSSSSLISQSSNSNQVIVFPEWAKGVIATNSLVIGLCVGINIYLFLRVHWGKCGGGGRSGKRKGSDVEEDGRCTTCHSRSDTLDGKLDTIEQKLDACTTLIQNHVDRYERIQQPLDARRLNRPFSLELPADHVASTQNQQSNEFVVPAHARQLPGPQGRSGNGSNEAGEQVRYRSSREDGFNGFRLV